MNTEQRLAEIIDGNLPSNFTHGMNGARTLFKPHTLSEAKRNYAIAIRAHRRNTKAAIERKGKLSKTMTLYLNKAMFWRGVAFKIARGERVERFK